VSPGFAASLLEGELEFVTDRFRLRPLDAGDEAGLFSHLSDPAVTRFMDIEALVDPDQAAGIIAWARSIRSDGAGVRWAIRALLDGRFVGTCGFNSLIFDRGCRGEVAYDVSKALWGERVMDEVLPRVLAFGFASLGLRRIEALVTEGNDPSCRLLERHDFAREGLLRQHGFWKDRFWDQVLYARIG
jgi:ribosomal-protein-alanine N-acetyltransferase